jgi:hypothetical protein
MELISWFADWLIGTLVGWLVLLQTFSLSSSAMLIP